MQVILINLMFWLQKIIAQATKGTKFLIKEFIIISTMMEGDTYTNERI